MKDWIGIKDYSDHDYNVDFAIDDIVRLDDPERLIALIKSPLLRRGYTVSNTVIKIVESICSYDAVNCATALLEGKLLEEMLGPTVDINMSIVNRGCLLYHAIMFSSPLFVQFCLSRGARTDITVDDERNIRGHDGMFPLEIALDMASWFISEENLFSRVQSTFQFLVSFCLPHTEENVFLEVCKLLAWSSENVGKDAYYYVMEGKLLEFVILLFVARKKVLAPVTFSSKG